MKKLLLLAATLMIGATMLKAQDTIVLRNGDELKVKVKEVSDTELKYQLWNNQEGPTYTKKVSDIFMVKYKGGHREVYGATQSQQTTGNANNNNANFGQNNVFNGSGYMEHSMGDIYLNGRKLNSFQIKEIFGDSGYNTYSYALLKRRAGKTNIIMGWIEFGLGSFLGVLGWYWGEPYSFYFGTAIFVASQIQLPIGYVFNGIGNECLNRLVDNYNNGQLYSDNLSIGFSPTLVYVPDVAGNRTFNLGARVSLNF